LDSLQKALDQLNSFGLQVTTLDLSGKLTRVRVDDDKGSKKSGWYVAHEFNLMNGSSVVVGRFGNWKLSDTTQSFEADFTFSLEDKAAYRKKMADDRARVEKERKRANADAVKRANKLHDSLPDMGNTEYLIRKKVRGYHVRYGKGDTLFVPVSQNGRGLVGFQVIAADGGKKFLTGTEKRGGFHCIGDCEKSDILLVAEGYATGASLFEATAYACFVAFDAGNLLPVVKMLRERWPDKRIAICADDDHATDNNPGLNKATVAANEVGGDVIVPCFLDKQDKTDFNDMHVEQGLDVVKHFVKSFLEYNKQKPTPALATPPDNDWRGKIKRNKDDAAIGNIFNVSTILSNHPSWQGVLARDDFSARIICRSAAPFGGDSTRPWTDTDDSRTVAWLTEHMNCSPQTKVVVEAVQMVAEDNSFHPVRDYLESIKWDGVDRVANLFIDYFGAEPDLPSNYSEKDKERFNNHIKYLQLVAVKFLVSAVARVMRPGCKVDTVLILEGLQGMQKSTSLKVLAGDWFTDTPFNLGDKDAFQSISGKWIIELAELDSFNKSESTRAKAFFSSAIDNYRVAYGRRNNDYPRQCVFVGTTNQHEYLRDSSGNRRYWPVECLAVDLRALKRDRDQLWAEALQMFKDGVLWWPSSDEMPLFEIEQGKRQIDDPWMLMIEQYLDEPERKLSSEKITINDLLGKCIGMDKSRIGERADAIRVGRCLASLGYVKRSQSAGKVPRRYYEKMQLR